MPKRAVAGDGRRRAVNTKVTDEIRAKLEASAHSSDRSLSHEIETRLSESFKNEALVRAVVDGGPALAMFRAMQAAGAKVRRVAGALKLSEPETRAELSAAMNTIAGVYLWTGADLPADPGKEPQRKVGEDRERGAIGRQAAYDWLTWEDDPFLEEAQGAVLGKDAVMIGNHWTNDSKGETDLIAVGFMSKERAAELRRAALPRTSLDDIMASRGDRNTSADTPLNVLAGEAPAKPVRARKKPA